MKSRIFLFSLYCFFFFIGTLKATEDVFIYYTKNGEPVEVKAAEELCRYLTDIYPQSRFLTTDQLSNSPKIVVGSYDQLRENFNLSNVVKPLDGGFIVTSVKGNDSVKKFIIGSDPRSTLDGVYALLEKLGYGFYLTHETKPLKKEKLDYAGWDCQDNPLVEDRIVFNWHNFLSGCTGWNYSDWQSWIEQSSKMRYNSIMVHAYANNPMFQFEMNGIKKPVGYMNTSSSGRDWGGQHVNDVRLLPGGDIFDGPVFGADVAKVPDEQRVDATIQLMQNVFRDAKKNGMKVIFALDCDTKAASPQEIVLSLPERARFKAKDAWLVNPEEPEGYSYYKKLVSDLITLYPEIDKLALWVRGAENSSWRTLTPANMPKRWGREYEEFLRNEGRVTNDVRTSSAFALAKMVKAYQKALKELGRGDVEVMLGTWHWEFVNVANYTMPKDVTFIPLDYSYVLNQPFTQHQLSLIGDRRKLIPIVWAHHDDHRYIGRSYRPYASFFDVLKTKNASGFGIIHWTNSPHDLFFLNLCRQIWKDSRNESLETTIKSFVRNEWKADNFALNEYFYKWSTEAPMFGRETGASFLGYNEFNLITKEFGSCDDIIEKAKERLALLESVDKKVTSQNPSLFEYTKDMERFYIEIFKNQKHFNRAYELLEQHKTLEAGKEMLQTEPEKVIESYAKAIKNGPKTIGEKAIVFSMGTRYYPHFFDLKQQAGMIPVNFRFGRTKHDKLAQGAGYLTWFIDDKKDLWRVLGKKEIGENVRESENHISFDKAIELNLVSIFNHTLPSGEYEILISTLSSENLVPLDIFHITGQDIKTKLEYISEVVNGKNQIRFKVNLKDEKSRLELLPKKEMKMEQMSIVKIN